MVVAIRYSNKTIDYSFYNFSYGEEPGKVNAIGICRGDIEPEDCRGFLKASTTLLLNDVEYKKEQSVTTTSSSYAIPLNPFLM
ncbi:salt stress response/antifungal domain protein [Medicago truncatula]|uniref:Salt stress response/antifungal domain protein n=1 Tax=Medicago truncatula TaxID=3880 RepID=A0A072VRB4_MEDTR|nr:salt stress response/antifungal domain protein [Medicago truncatula]